MQSHSIEAFDSDSQQCIHIALNHLSPTLTYTAYIAFSHLSLTLGYAYIYHLQICDQPSANHPHIFEPFESNP